MKIVATRFRILRLKCTKFDFGCGYAPDPAGGAYSAPQTPNSWIWGHFGGGAGLGMRRESGRREREGPQVTVEPGPLGALLRHCYRRCGRNLRAKLDTAIY